MEKSNYEIFNILLNTDIAKLKAIKSIVNVSERTPSLKFYYNTHLQDWYFKDFSSGEHGGPVKFLMLKENISYKEALSKIKQLIDTKPSISENKKIINTKKEKIIKYDVVQYNDDDLNYWSKYKINKRTLIKYNVYPIINFSMNEYKFYNRWIGYFDDKCSLLQLYAPANSIYNNTDKKKFINIKSKVIFYKHYSDENIIITKSLKDMMVLDVLYGDKYSYVSWIGETQKIEKDISFHLIINKYKNRYINYDNDSVGLKRMEELKAYGLIPLIVNGYKDVSDYIVNENSTIDLFKNITL